MSALLYSLLVRCIRTYKSIQMRFYRGVIPTILPIAKKRLARLGITINGDNKWDPQVKNEEFYLRVACDGNLGAGEAYMDGLWECEALDQLTEKVMRCGLAERAIQKTDRLDNFLFKYFNLQTRERAWEVGEKHYDLGNELYEAMLDPYMQYTCGYWKNADNLNDAQINKMDLIARKLMLEPGMRVLDIGCGWGGLAKYLAEKYKVQVVGCTISKEGAKYGQNFCADLPVDIRLNDYRDMDEKFDRITAVGILEHVGPSNYRTFFEVAHRCLKDDGIFLCHNILVNHPKMTQAEPWTNTYIFPNSVAPRHTDIPEATTGLFIIEDVHNISHDYSRTLMAWYDNFIKAWPKLSSTRGDRFFRMWKYYLLGGAGAFRARRLQLWQVVLTKNGLEGGYEAAR